ncbi:MAG: hypothetical protein QOC62_5644 [Mycobacterium sp.]|jgi:D-arabinose 1-dehydrogenase-like Zn-dependent alcohol dehydrogenase|nr:hypothetical protein [Mycobacterium sp.]
MSTHPLVADLVTTFKAEGRIVIVGASLAGLRGAEALREAYQLLHDGKIQGRAVITPNN